MASCCIQVWNAALVRASNVRKISSSWTEGCTCALGRVPSSGSFGAFLSPWVSSTYVSPRSVFCLSIARVFAGIGA
jgi:hypothetical protein